MLTMSPQSPEGPITWRMAAKKNSEYRVEKTMVAITKIANLKNTRIRQMNSGKHANIVVSAPLAILMPRSRRLSRIL